MNRNVRLLIFTILVLFVMPLVFIQGVSADPLESFTENPTSYWKNNSTNVNLTWDSSAQTVEFESNISYVEGFNNISDWVDVDGTITTDGNIASVTLSYTGDNQWKVWAYTNEVSGNYYGQYFKTRFYVNESIDYIGAVCFADDDRGDYIGGLTENLYAYGATGWYNFEAIIIIDANIESFQIQARGDTGENVLIQFDYLIIGEPYLDIAVPLEKDTIQNIETMGNFSALNSTVRFQMYDNVTDSGLWCDVNSTQVTFPDNTYAEFNDLVRIDFSLNEEISIFTISVSAQNMTLINYYSDYAELANKDYLLMTDSVFNGTYHLWYLQGDVGYLEESEDMALNIFEELFLSTDIWVYFGPLALIVVSFIILTNKKLKPLGILFIIVEFLVLAIYLDLVEATPWYWWNIIIMILGIIICIGQMWSR